VSLSIVGLDAQVAFFDRHIPRAVQKEIVSIICRAYLDANQEVNAKYGFHEAHDLRGYTRRANIERDLHRLPVLFPWAVKVESLDNYAHNWYHAEVASQSGPVVSTISKVRDCRADLPVALFRQTLARGSQLCLLLDGEPLIDIAPAPVEGERLWAAIIHGCDSVFATRPDFCRVAFPSEDGRHQGAGIDLLARFASDEADLYTAADEAIEHIADDAPIQLKPIRREDQEEGPA